MGEIMVLPVDPNSIPINATTGLADVNNSMRKDMFIGVTNNSIPDAPPSMIYAPVLVAPTSYSMLDYSLIVNSAISNAIDMDFYGRQVDELITKRFYGANAANVFSAFITSVNTVNTIYNAQISDPHYLTYLQGLNTNVPAINNAIQTYLAGLTLEEQQIQTINDAIATFENNPVTPLTIATLNTAIASYNAYASIRELDIQNYNAAVNTYNANIATVNTAVNIFNITFNDQGALVPLPLIPTAVLRNSLPLNLPVADESATLAADLGAALGIIIGGSLSPYVAYTYINSEITTQTINAPNFGGAVTVNSAIAALNSQTPARQQAVNDLNTAIANFNDISNVNYGDSAVLQVAIDVYNFTVSSGNLDTDITNFNSEVVNNFNATLGATINNGINVINSYIPPSLLQYSQIILPTLAAMPTAPSGLYLPGAVFPLAVPELYQSVPIIQTPQLTEQTFAPFLNSNNEVLTDSSQNIMLTLPSVDGIPPVINPSTGDFSQINSHFINLNNSITAYNLTVGTITNPAVGTENGLIQDLNNAISNYNTTPTQVNLDALIAANNLYIAASVPINAAITVLNDEVDTFNTGLGPNTLASLNSEINLINEARNFYGLPSIPNYYPLPSRAMMPSALSLQPNLNLNPSSFGLLPTRSEFSTVPDMLGIEIDAVFVLGLASTVNFSLSDMLYQTYEQVESVSFNAYVDKLKNSLSPLGYVDVDQFDLAVTDYNTTALTPIPGSMSAVDFPPGTVSGLNVMVDSTTQQSVTQNLLSLINSTPMTLTDTEITQYNNYAALVNSTSVQTMNNAIDTFNAAVGVADPQNPVTVPNPDDPTVNITTDYPPGTLNFYASINNQNFSDQAFYGPLSIVDNLSPVIEMPGGLPSLAAFNVIIDGVPVNFYEAISQLNQAMGPQPTGGALTADDINNLINAYNTSGVIGSTLSMDVNTENGAINVLNTSIDTTFSTNTSADYFNALTQLQLSIDAYNLTHIPPLNSTITSLNTNIDDFNANSLAGLNAFAQPNLNAINVVIENNFPLNSFVLLSPTTGIENVSLLPEYSVSANSGVVPGTLSPVPGNIGLQPSLQFSMDLPDRTLSGPQAIPTYFSTLGPASDLVNLKNTVYDPLIAMIQDYNQQITSPTNGINFENSLIDTLNISITAFNDGLITSVDLKNAVDTYVKAVSTNATNANDNIATLNAAIANWDTELDNANSSLTFWGFSPIQNVFRIPERGVMPTPPMPVPDSSSNYLQPVTLVSTTTPQTFPSASATVINPNTGAPITIQVHLELNQVNYQLLGVTELSTLIRIVSILLGFANVQKVASLIVNIEKFVELQNNLRGPRGEFANAYIEPTGVPNQSVGILGSIALTTMAIGLPSHLFSELLNTNIFKSILALYNLPNSPSVLRGLENVLMNLVFKAALLAAPSTMSILSGRIPPPTSAGLISGASTPVGPAFALHFIDQIRSLIGSGAIPTLIKGTFGGRVSGQKLDNLSAAFNIGLLNVTLSVLARVFGTGVIPAILIHVPTIAAFGVAGRAPDFLSPLTFDNVLRGNMDAVKKRLIKGLRGLIQAGVVHMSPGNLGSLVQNSVVDQLTNIFLTPGQFQDTLNFLLMKATGQKQIRQLRQLAFDSAAFVADQLASVTANEGILGHSIDLGVLQQGGLKDALAAAAPNSPQINLIASGVMADLIKKNSIKDSIIKSNALAFQLHQNAIRRDLINHQTISQAKLDQQNSLGSVRDSILADKEAQDALEQQAIDRYGLADRVVEQLIQNDIIKRASINYDTIKRELVKREIIDDYATNEVVAFQREFERQQRIGTLTNQADAGAAMIQALQNVFNIDGQQANAIAQNVQLLYTQIAASDILGVGNGLEADKLRSILYQLLKDRLVAYDVKLESVLFGALKQRIIEDHNSFVNLMEDQVNLIVSMNNQKLNRIIHERFNAQFINRVNFGKFVENRLLAPAYSLIYSTDSGPMYAKPEHNTNFVNSIDIHI